MSAGELFPSAMVPHVLIGNALVPYGAPAGEVLQVLRGARRSLERGFSPHFSRLDNVDACAWRNTPIPALDVYQRGYTANDGELRVVRVGSICSPHDQGARFFDTDGALRVALGALSVDVLIVAEDLLAAVHGSREWDAMPLPALLTLFDRAILRVQVVVRRK